jgi:Tfp pilus assembly protein PilF
LVHFLTPGDTEKNFKKAITIDSRFSLAVFNLAVLRFHLGDSKTSRKYFAEALALDPALKHQALPYLEQLE